MIHSEYKPGKLYKTKAYFWLYFSLWDPKPVCGHYRILFSTSFKEGLIFLYIKFFPAIEKSAIEKRRALHLVVYQDFVGFVDAEMELEELTSPGGGSLEFEGE